jgi:eukaryotic-like serine/threonine-protein kinase
LLKAGTKLGAYDIGALIGAGGMGEVYRARDTRLQRDVALKILPEIFAADPARMARFEREARLLASLNHPHIAAIYGVEESYSCRALVMELVEGPTLAERIAAGPVPVDEALPMMKQVAEALEYAHDHGVIHRDLKPANIKVTAEGTVKVLDFGLAKALTDEPTETDLRNSPTLSAVATMQGVILGTAAYMSPEQAKGKPVDRRADIWAFGVVLVEMLTGKALYTGETAAETLASVMMKDPSLGALPASTPPAIRNLLQRCLNKDPRQRLRDIGEARIILADALAGAAPVEPVAAHRKTRERLLPVVATVAAVAVAVALVLAFLHFRRVPAEMRSARFFVEPPEKTTFLSAPNLVSVSPDGTRLAFIAVDSSGKQLLWVRALDSLTAQPLLGTDGASQPFWSPDSQFIAFSAENKLKRIAVSGGPPQTITALTTGNAMGTWNREGVILFGTGLTTIQRVSTAGGKPTPLTTLDASRQQDFHTWPCFLPDGKHFLYFAHSVNPENSAIYVGSLDSKDTKLLLNASSFILYSPPGYLLFLREGALVAQPFDAGRLELTGEAFPMAEDVRFNPANGRAAFAVSENGVLAFRTGGTFSGSGQFTWTDLAGKEVTSSGDVSTMGATSHFSLSPDEKRVAIDLTTPQGRDAWLLDITRGTISRFALGLLSAGLAWSPDSNWLAFTASRSGVTGLYRRLSNGAGQDELLLNAPEAQPTDWSQDGRFLLYQTLDPKTRLDLWVLPLSGDRKPKPFLQTEFDESQGQFSPDGRWVAYSSDESGRPEVYVQPFPGPGPKVQISTGGGMLPKWRRDGKELFYRIDGTGKLVAAEVKTDGQFQAGVPQPLPWQAGIVIHGMSAGGHYAISADGKRFFSMKAKQESAEAPVTVVLNWTAVLKK